MERTMSEETKEVTMRIFTVEKDVLVTGVYKTRFWEVVASYAHIDEQSRTLSFYTEEMDGEDLSKITLIGSFNAVSWSRFHDQEEYFADVTERENPPKDPLIGTRG